MQLLDGGIVSFLDMTCERGEVAGPKCADITCWKAFGVHSLPTCWVTD